VNSCSVTASADQGTRQTIRRLARLNPAARVIVTGCYATRERDEVAALPGVVGVVANSRKDDLISLSQAAGWLSTAERFGEGDDACGGWSPGLGGRTALTMRVQTGCDERCSYCIIPRTRGTSRSEPIESVLSRISAAVAAGYREIVLTGVHLGSYGRDLDSPTSLAELIRRLGEWTGDVLFRISSLEPNDCTPEIVDLVAGSPRLAPHFHLPLQHASDDILSAMCRPYRFAEYEALVNRIRRLMPHASIGSDIVVGFPGERDSDFDLLLNRLAALPLTHLHVFPYSDRPGTAASVLRDKVDGAVIRSRARAVREIGAGMARAFRRSQQGRRCRGLTLEDGRSAVTGNYLKVQLDRQLTRNAWVDVDILDGDALRATVVSLLT
jgi:threonylcarbamoyladenosine tRNA methylthiotransferase MtaB